MNIQSLKRVGLFNIVLVFISLLLETRIIIGLNGADMTSISLFEVLNHLSSIIGIVVGIFYLFSGYKKSDAKYYKLFMFLLLLCCMFNLVVSAYELINNFSLSIMIITLLDVIKIVCIFVLTYTKNFGKMKSIITSLIGFVCSVIILIISIILSKYQFIYLVSLFDCVLLFYLACIFVNAKYIDKDSRGVN